MTGEAMRKQLVPFGQIKHIHITQQISWKATLLANTNYFFPRVPCGVTHLESTWDSNPGEVNWYFVGLNGDTERLFYRDCVIIINKRKINPEE